jgi:hypothetical protein
MAADIVWLEETHNKESIDYKIPGYYCIYTIQINNHRFKYMDKFKNNNILNNIKLKHSYKINSKPLNLQRKFFYNYASSK